MDEALPATGEPLPPDWALQDPDDYCDVLRHAVPAAVADAGIDPEPGGRDRHRLHRLHGAARAGRRDPAVPAPGARGPGRTPTPSCGSTTRPSRRPTGSTPWPAIAASRGSAATAARSRPSGSSPRRCSCSRRTPRPTSARDRWIEAADWIIWQLAGVETRNACTAGYKGIRQDGRYPSRDFLAQLDPRLRRLRRGQARAPGPAAGRAGRVADREAAAWTGPARGDRGRGRQRRRPRDPARRRRDRARADGRDHGHLGLPRDERRRRWPRCRACAAWSTAASWPGCGATRPGRAASATSSPGSPSRRCRPPTWRRRTAAGCQLHDLLSAEAAAQPAGAHGLVALDWLNGNRSVLVDHHLSGAIVGLTLATPRTRHLPRADRGDGVRHAGHHRRVRRRRACRSANW